MAYGVDNLSGGAVIRKWVFLAVGAFLLGAGITAVFLSMRSVMDVGGFCAQGGPYQIRQTCPDNSWLLFVGIFAGLIGAGCMIIGRMRGGPSLVLLAWPALFLALGWNFLIYGFDPPPPATGVAWGWLICAIVFALMGLPVLIYMIVNWRNYFWSANKGLGSSAEQFASVFNNTPFFTVTQPGSRPGASEAQTITISRDGGSITIGGTEIVTGTDLLGGTAPPGPSESSGDDLAENLERLAALHASGQLTDEEFAAAKAQLLSEGPHA